MPLERIATPQLFRNLQEAGAVAIYDGSKGTSLMEHAHAANLPLVELLNLYNPTPVYTLAEDYILAGSDIIQTNTFSANKYVLEQHGRQESVVDINQLGAEIARRAAGPDHYVAGSMGPTGKIVGYPTFSGGISETDAMRAFETQAFGLKQGGVDFYHIETMDNELEITAAIKAIRMIDRDANIVVTATFPKKTNKLGDYVTQFGLTPKKLLILSERESLQAYGTNCGFGINGAEALVKQLAKEGEVLVVKLNKGQPTLGEAGQMIYPDTDIEEYTVLMRQLGAKIIGTCCGTTPEDIRRISATLKSRV